MRLRYFPLLPDAGKKGISMSLPAPGFALPEQFAELPEELFLKKPEPLVEVPAGTGGIMAIPEPGCFHGV